MIVVDTSVLIDLFRGATTPAADRLRQVERTGVPFGIPGICCQELLQGAADEKEWKLLLRYLGTQHTIHAKDPWETHVQAARIYHDARRRGLTIRSTLDCLIAQLVLEVDGDLLHDDDDFESIRKVRPLRTLRG